MKKLLVTTDLSVNSKSGIRFALQLAKQSGCTLTFLHNLEVTKPTSWSKSKYDAYAKAEISKSTLQMKAFIEDILNELNVNTKPYTLATQIGFNVGELTVAYAKKIKADYICLSTRGAGTVKKIFGTHASYLVTHSPIPVIVVPEHYHTKAITNIWYSSDMENISNELKTMEALAKSIKAKVQVNHYNYLLDEKSTKTKLQSIASKYKSALTSFKLRKLKLDHSMIHYIETDIQKEHPSMVALFTKQNHNWFSRFFLGSNSEEMSFATHTPLIVFRKKSR